MKLYQAITFCVLFSAAVASYDYVEEMQALKHRGHYNGPGHRVGSFSYSNCNTTVVPVYVTSLSIRPDIVHLGRKLAVSAGVLVMEDIGSVSPEHELEAKLEIKMKIGGEYKDMCELLGPKVCHVQDLCRKLVPLAAHCPAIIRKKCQCPIKKNKYRVNNFTITLPDSPFEVAGSFEVTIHLVEKSKELACLDLKFCIEHC